MFLYYMVVVQNIDRDRNLYRQTLYSGCGYSKTPKAYYHGGFVDLSTLLTAGKTAIERLTVK